LHDILLSDEHLKWGKIMRLFKYQIDIFLNDYHLLFGSDNEGISFLLLLVNQYTNLDMTNPFKKIVIIRKPYSIVVTTHTAL
jgi:hypothetical protein